MTQSRLKFAFLLAPAIAVLASGCANRHSVTVGAVPDDYRTNHPIMISEKEQVLDLPVGRTDKGATKAQIATLEGFLANYDRGAAPVLTILTPSGSANAHVAAKVAQEFARVAKRNGVPPGRIVMIGVVCPFSVQNMCARGKNASPRAAFGIGSGSWKSAVVAVTWKTITCSTAAAISGTSSIAPRTMSAPAIPPSTCWATAPCRCGWYQKRPPA